MAWGDAGAYGMTRDGVAHHCTAFPPENVVDTLGAGDTFNAGLINALVNGKNLQQALEAGCQLAGRKCGIEGFSV